MITIHGRATSSNVQAVMWLVGELGLEHRRIDRGHVHGGLDDPDFRAINPHGLVPALEDGAVRMFESSAILRYLAAQYGAGAGFWPDSPAARTEGDAWAEWAKTSLAPKFTAPIFWARVRTAAKDRDEAALSAAIDSFEAALGMVEARLADNEWVSGDEIGLADIVAGHVLYRYYDIDIQRRDLPRVRALYERYATRAAYRDHVMISYDALRVDGA